ncbi:11073_t:CDS:1 [Diversispora eburnea]|uniref:11073_t:CDS:1 n=1 Tax=Diversispora eburnea TaxID=1213867 RepID=A0A9N8YZ56_9GLOM|nr:11073_t:CDS:1 [Diversispora eburnea]
MSSFSDSFSNFSTPTNSLPAELSNRDSTSLIFDDSLSLEQLACPICNETSINLFQLNQHLDDAHTDAAIDQRDKIIKWFKNAQSTLMKPLSKTKNISTQMSQMALHVFNDIDANWLDQQSENVTRELWQKEGENDHCSNSSCNKGLNLKNGKNNCRK